MPSRSSLIEMLRLRPEVIVEEDADRWLVRIPKGVDECEVEIPKKVFEWFACVKRGEEKKEVWRDWMDHYDSSDEELEAEMTECISSFIERVKSSELKLPLRIYEEKTASQGTTSAGG